jgi:hypothetical protein
MARGFRNNYNPLNIIRGRFSNVSVYGAGHRANFYAPNQGGILSSIGNIGSKDNPRFSGGVIGRLGALSKMERLSNKGGIRASKKLAKFDMNLARVMAMNNPQALVAPGYARTLASTTSSSLPAGMRGTAASRLAAARATIATPAGARAAIQAGNMSTLGLSLTGAAGATAVTNGMRRVAITEGVKGRYSRAMVQSILTSGGGAEMRTLGAAGRTVAFGSENIVMNETAEKLIRPLAGALEKNPALMNRAVGRGITGSTHLGAPLSREVISGRAGLAATQISEKGIIKSLGVKGAAQAVKAGGARVGLAVAAEAGLAAIPGVNLIFAADLAFQLAKLAGLGVKAGVNFAKDGVKSMEGTMNNGVFGNGYKDNEVAATSRARGVMAIQNSRLNARSLLGSEGSMMHAHFG